jgi:hypothetical protein
LGGGFCFAAQCYTWHQEMSWSGPFPPTATTLAMPCPALWSRCNGVVGILEGLELKGWEAELDQTHSQCQVCRVLAARGREGGLGMWGL